MKTSLKKIIPYLLLLLILSGVGFFGGGQHSLAEEDPPPAGTTTPPTPPEKPSDPQKNALQQEVDKLECLSLTEGSVGACVIHIAYFVWYQVPGAVLGLVGMLFDTFLALTLGSYIYNNDFIREGWAVVRDLANIFFIIVLLYISLQIILGLTHHGVKQMIAKVIIMAMLINFSLFFTKVVIDTSNILALVFYNKILVEDKTGGTVDPAFKDSVSGVQQKPVSAAFMSAFSPARLTSPDMFARATEKEQTSKAVQYLVRSSLFVVTFGASAFFGTGTATDVPVAFYLTIILVSGAMFWFTAYIFFVAAFSFLGRMVELWVLLIASPFAFMTFAFPQLGEVEYAGWGSWSSKLLKTAFMAPIFMFFLYLISKLININIFKDLINDDSKGWVALILIIIIPTIVNFMLLHKAVHYAKTGAGMAGEILGKWGAQLGGMVGGLAIGAATGGASMVGRATLGSLSNDMANNDKLKQKSIEKGFGGFMARRALEIGEYGSKASFDIRNTKLGGAAIGGMGINAGKAKTGGFVQARKEQVEKRQKWAKKLELGEDSKLVQDLHNLEESKQSLMVEFSHDIEQLDNRIKVWKERAADARRAKQNEKGEAASSIWDKTLNNGAGGYITNNELAKRAEEYLADMQGRRKAIKDGRDYQVRTEMALLHEGEKVMGDAVKYSESARIKIINPDTGKEEKVSINDLEDDYIPHQHHKVEHTNKARKRAEAEREESGGAIFTGFVASGGVYTKKVAREAAHKIKMEAKIEDKGGHGGGHSGGGHAPAGGGAKASGGATHGSAH